MRLFGLIAFVLAAIGQVCALSEFACLEVAHNFVQSFIAPLNAVQSKAINSTLFSDDVKGTVDVTTNFDGRELSTEYIFGLFVNLAKDPTNPSPLGRSAGYNLTHVAVQHNSIAANFLVSTFYPVLNETYPIEIQIWLNINEQRQITEYDVTFRRWQWFADFIVPRLIPHMKTFTNTQSDNDTYVLQQYFAQATCKGAQQFCVGSNQQYDSYNSCMEFVTSIDVGEWTRLGEDSLGCRWLHTAMLEFRPSVHCAHVGPSGGDMCIPRDYAQVVSQSHFSQGFLAPKYVTPENRKQVQNIYATTNQSLSPLLEISMWQQDEHSWDPTFYATGTFVFFLVLYISSRVTSLLLNRFNKVFPTLAPTIQKNVVAYVLTIIFTTVALALELVGAPTFAGEYRLWAVQSVRISCVIIVSLYCWELTYRDDMRLPLVLHHFFTIFAVSFTIIVFEYTESLTYMVSGIVWLFQATTEQPTFIGLLAYRLKWNAKWTGSILKFAAIQTFVLKTASAMALLIYWGIRQNYRYQSIDIAWSAMVWIIAVGLMLTQVWGSWITYQIGVRVSNARSTSSVTNSLPHYNETKSTSNASEEHKMSLGRTLGLSQPQRSHARVGSSEMLLYPRTTMGGSRSPSPAPSEGPSRTPSPTNFGSSYFLPRTDAIYADDSISPRVEPREDPGLTSDWNRYADRR